MDKANMKNRKNHQAIQEVLHSMRRGNRAALMFIQKSVAAAGIHPTDVRVIEFLQEMKEATAGVLSEISGLTTGATTAMIDRLEKAGIVTRKNDPDDRRKINVVLKEKNIPLPPFFDTFYAELETVLETFDEKDLTAIKRFNAEVERIFQARTPKTDKKVRFFS